MLGSDQNKRRDQIKSFSSSTEYDVTGKYFTDEGVGYTEKFTDGKR